MDAYWSASATQLLERLRSSEQGLTAAEAASRLQSCGKNEIAREVSHSRLRVLARQLANPLLFLLIIAALISSFAGEWTDAAIVISIVVASAWIGYRREYTAHEAAAALRDRIRARTRVLRDGKEQAVLIEEVVPGDIVLLAAGSLVPADGVILDSNDAYVSEAALTGESYPVAKVAGPLPAETPLAKRTNCVHLGTNVRSGSLRIVIVKTGLATQFGSIARRLEKRQPKTEFDRGMQRFGYLLTSAMLVIVFLVFVAHTLAGREPVETLLFSIALAVGLSPELLPAILSFNLARGAEMLAQRGVLVRRLNAIENLGSMDVLCTDKTGTLTEGVIQLEGAYNWNAEKSAEVITLGALNATFESGLASPLDDAIVAHNKPDVVGIQKLAEIPFDFIRKRVSVIVEDAKGVRLIAKGAFRQMVQACSTLADGSLLDETAREKLDERYTAWALQGVRVLAVAYRTLNRKTSYTRDDEADLIFAGFLTFLDRPKAGAAEAIAELKDLGITVKLISGDSAEVSKHVASIVGLSSKRVLTGAELDELHDEALWRDAERTDLFVEVDPNQKERIILALKKMGHVVGFLGDGVNDAPAMHAADTSLSVEQAVDVAREAADFVLLERGLDVIRRGVEEGRRTFMNTLKYVLTTTSANLGNMISMAAASLMLPFLPLLAGQILLNNFLSDIPAVGLAGDSVDRELVIKPRRWDIKFIARYMVEFGLLSSVFDFMTFGVLLYAFHASPDLFRTGWFVESLLTELVIAIVVRTRRPFFLSRPGRLLLSTTMLLIAVTLAIPYLPLSHLFGFIPLPATLTGMLILITMAYVLGAEILKRWFYRRDFALEIVRE